MNVKNLKSHDKGRTLEVIRRVLVDDLGYRVSMRVIDAAGLVPQHRERIFIVGTAPGLAPVDISKAAIPAASDGPRLREILHPEDGSELPESPYTEGLGARVNGKYTLTPRLWAYLQAYAAKHRAAGNGFGFGLVGGADVARTMSARYYKDGSEILIEQPGLRPRRLTPREAARLMGFAPSSAPRHFARRRSNQWAIPVSDTQAYRQFGNAVVPAVVAALACQLVHSVSAANSGARPVVAWPRTPRQLHAGGVEVAA